MQQQNLLLCCTNFLLQENYNLESTTSFYCVKLDDQLLNTFHNNRPSCIANIWSSTHIEEWCLPRHFALFRSTMESAHSDIS